MEKYLTNEEIGALGEKIKQEVELIGYFYFLESKNLVKRSRKSNLETDESKFIYWENTSRGECTPSLALNTRDNYFKDFGDDNCKGDIFAAAQYFEGLSYPMAVRRIAKLFLPLESLDVKVETKAQVREKVDKENVVARSNIKITKVYDHVDSLSLQQYMHSRGFASDSIAYFAQRGYINEVHWTNAITGKKGYGIGFKANGNYVISFPTKDGNFKFNTGAVRPVMIDGHLKADTINVFEGFFDFLAYKELFPWGHHKSLILNSVVYKEECIKLLESELQASKDISIELYLDNDNSGKQLARELVRHFEKKNVDIFNSFTNHTIFSVIGKFAELKDINDFLILAKRSKFSVKTIDNNNGDISLFVNTIPRILYPVEAKIFLNDMLKLAKQVNYHLMSALDFDGQIKSYEVIMSMNDAIYDKLENLQARRPTLPKLLKYFISCTDTIFKKLGNEGDIGIDVKNIEQNIAIVENAILQDHIEKFRSKVLHAFDGIGIKDPGYINAKFDELKNQPKVENLDKLIEHMRSEYRRVRMDHTIKLQQEVKTKAPLKIKM